MTTKYAKVIRLTEEQLEAQREATRRRQAAFIERKRQQGLSKVTFFLDEEAEQRVRAYVARILKAAKKPNPCKSGT